MSRRIRGRISSAHVISMIALILAMTGTSVALSGKNTVDSGDIRNHTVQGADVRNNTLNGNQIAEQKLSAVRLATSAIEARNVLWAAVKNPNGAGNAAVLRSGQGDTVVGEGNNLVNVGLLLDCDEPGRRLRADVRHPRGHQLGDGAHPQRSGGARRRAVQHPGRLLSPGAIRGFPLLRPPWRVSGE